MKKMISLMTAVLLAVCLMAGCGEAENGQRAIEQGGQQVKEGVSSVVDAEKDMMNDVKNTVQGNVGGMSNGDNGSMNNSNNNGMTNSNNTGMNNNSTPTDEEKSRFIGEEKAKEIALKKADVTTESVIFDRVELEHDGGVWKYEVDFKKDTTEYDAEINATDGSILKWKVEKD